MSSSKGYFHEGRQKCQALNTLSGDDWRFQGTHGIIVRNGQSGIDRVGPGLQFSVLVSYVMRLIWLSIFFSCFACAVPYNGNYNRRLWEARGGKTGLIWLAYKYDTNDNEWRKSISDSQCVFHGIKAGEACCTESCGSCGGSGCSDRTGGSHSCCTGTILNDVDRPCSLFDPPCSLPDPQVSLRQLFFLWSVACFPTRRAHNAR